MCPTSHSVEAKTWKELYIAALFESDFEKLAARIADAEHAVVLRARQLFSESGDNYEEGEALDNAMYSLNALRNVYRFEPNGVRSASSWMDAA